MRLSMCVFLWLIAGRLADSFAWAQEPPLVPRNSAEGFRNEREALTGALRPGQNAVFGTVLEEPQNKLNLRTLTTGQTAEFQFPYGVPCYRWAAKHFAAPQRVLIGRSEVHAGTTVHIYYQESNRRITTLYIPLDSMMPTPDGQKWQGKNPGARVAEGSLLWSGA